MRRALRLACLHLLPLALATLPTNPTAAQESDDLRLGLKVGVESDSNAAREEGLGATGDVLTRYFLLADADHALGAGQSLSARLRSGGKLYRHTAQETALLNQADVRYTTRPLLAFEQDWLFLYASASLKDRTDRQRSRDFLAFAATVGAGLKLWDVTLSAGGGWRSFAFKPDPDLSSDGPGWEASARWAITDAWVLQGGVSQQQRFFDARRFVQRVDGTVVRVTDPEDLRYDNTTSWFAALQYRGPVIAQLSGTLLDNASDSYGQALQRLGAALNLTVPLPWELVFNGRASLQRTSYGDAIFLDETYRIDEDNRNTFVAALEWPLNDLVSVEVKYSAFTQEFGLASADYFRQLVFAGVGFEL